MKGLKHNVIEINDTQNEAIDRILVFLKPDATDIAVMSTRAQATALLKELDIQKVSKKPKYLRAIIAASIGIIAILILLFFIL